MREHLFAMGVATLIGVLCGFGAILFRQLIILFQRFFWHASYLTVEVLRDQPAWRLVGMPAVGGLAVGAIVYHYAQEARGHGVPEVMAAVALKNGIIRARVAIAKIFSAALTIASGGS
ncbi:MAG: chloride channel protein, partial [Verrucomicrobia bacterium]|nr:chloride channel protein [Verrucomicrobiota bacterium]